MIESFSWILLPRHETLTQTDTPTLVLPFYLLTTLYLNLTIPLSHYSFYFDSSSPHVFYYKYLFFSLPFYLYFSHKNRWILSLSLSLGEFLILCCTSNLGWWIFLLNSTLGWSNGYILICYLFFFFFFFFNSHIWMTLT